MSETCSGCRYFEVSVFTDRREPGAAGRCFGLPEPNTRSNTMPACSLYRSSAEPDEPEHKFYPDGWAVIDRAAVEKRIDEAVGVVKLFHGGWAASCLDRVLNTERGEASEAEKDAAQLRTALRELVFGADDA